jgi:hypothetical protein
MHEAKAINCQVSRAIVQSNKSKLHVTPWLDEWDRRYLVPTLNWPTDDVSATILPVTPEQDARC